MMSGAIYLAGDAGDCAYWRSKFAKAAEDIFGKGCVTNANIACAVNSLCSEYEKEMAATKIRNCKVLVVNLYWLQSDIKAIYDVSIADEINRSGKNRIYIIGYGEMPHVPRMSECIWYVGLEEDDVIYFISHNNLI